MLRSGMLARSASIITTSIAFPLRGRPQKQNRIKYFSNLSCQPPLLVKKGDLLRLHSMELLSLNCLTVSSPVAPDVIQINSVSSS